MVFGPEPLPLNTRINRRAPNQHLKKKCKRDRARLARLVKKKVVKEERLRREKEARDSAGRDSPSASSGSREGRY